MSGWICLYRDIQDHWVFQDAEQFRAWVDLLMLANHKPKKFSIKGQLVSCDAGQLGVSQVTLGSRWGWHRDRVGRFLKLLEKDGMITVETTHLTSFITICNYTAFQSVASTDTTSDATPDKAAGTTPDPTADTTADTTQPTIKQLNKKTKKQVNNIATPKPVSNVNEYLAVLDITGQLAEDFIAHRKRKKAEINKTVMDGFAREATKAGISIQDAIRISIERNWQSFKAEWVKDDQPKKTGMIWNGIADQDWTKGVNEDGSF